MKKIIFTISAFITVVFVVLMFSKCTNVVSSSSLIFPDSLISYQRDVAPFMAVKCAYAGCHGDNPIGGASRMSDYISLMGSDNIGLIIPTKPDNSILIQILENTLPHLYYAFPQGYITDNQKKGMRQWILEGAKSN